MATIITGCDIDASSEQFVQAYVKNGRPSVRRVEDVVAAVLQAAAPQRILWERRSEARLPFTRPIAVTPTDEEGRFVVERTFSALGKNLSSRGIAFLNLEPICSRRVLVWLPATQRELAALVVDLAWCRAAGFGWYENGGSFVHVWDHPQPTEEQVRRALRQRRFLQPPWSSDGSASVNSSA